jgi:hypothetical protein
VSEASLEHLLRMRQGPEMPTERDSQHAVALAHDSDSEILQYYRSGPGLSWRLVTFVDLSQAIPEELSSPLAASWMEMMKVLTSDAAGLRRASASAVDLDS